MSGKAKLTRIFVSNDIVRETEDKAASERDLVGRPTLHAACLILGMLAVKSVFGLGYRNTVSLFRSAGWQNLPDFRTLGWRAEKMRKEGVSVRIWWCESGAEQWILVKKGKEGVFRIPPRVAKRTLRSLGTDYVELAL